MVKRILGISALILSATACSDSVSPTQTFISPFRVPSFQGTVTNLSGLPDDRISLRWDYSCTFSNVIPLVYSAPGECGAESGEISVAEGSYRFHGLQKTAVEMSPFAQAPSHIFSIGVAARGEPRPHFLPLDQGHEYSVLNQVAPSVPRTLDAEALAGVLAEITVVRIPAQEIRIELPAGTRWDEEIGRRVAVRMETQVSVVGAPARDGFRFTVHLDKSSPVENGVYRVPARLVALSGSYTSVPRANFKTTVRGASGQLIAEQEVTASLDSFALPDLVLSR